MLKLFTRLKEFVCVCVCAYTISSSICCSSAASINKTNPVKTLIKLQLNLLENMSLKASTASTGDG